MSFSRAQIRRFNDVKTHVPPVGTYDPKVDGTIPYPKDQAACLMRRDSWTGSTQSLWSLNSDRLSSRSSCASVASERIATRLHSSGCLGVPSARQQKVWTGRDGAREGGRTGWWREVVGRTSGKAVSEFNVKGSVKAKGGYKGGVARGNSKDEAKTQVKGKANCEDGCEVKAKARIVVGPETGDRVSGNGMKEATCAASDEVMIEVTDEAKCENSRGTLYEVDGNAIVEANAAKANCQATGEATAHHKRLSKYPLSISKAVQSEINQLERSPKESGQERQQEKLAAYRKSQRLRSEVQRVELNLLQSQSGRLTDGDGPLRKKQIQDSNPGQEKRSLKRFPDGGSGLLIEVVDHISRAEEEAEGLRTRVDELEREKVELEQAKILTERDLMDEVSWRTEELEKTETLLVNIREAKRRCKVELKKCQALVENLRLDYLKSKEELEGSRATVNTLQTKVRRSGKELEKTLLMLNNLRLEHSRKTEALEKSQSLAEHLKSENLQMYETLEESRSLVANISTEIQTKTKELESSHLALRNLQLESNEKTTVLENSRLTVDNLQLENHRCKDALQRCQSQVDCLLAKRCYSEFTQWTPTNSENTFDPYQETSNFEARPCSPFTDEDCEMAEEPEVESNPNDRTFVRVEHLFESSRSGESESEIQRSANLPQTDFELVENWRLLPELSDVRKSLIRLQESPSRVHGSSSEHRESCSETQSFQLRSSLSLDEEEPRKENRQRLMGVKSEPILTDDLTAICNQIQFLSLDDNGTSSKAEKRELESQIEIHENLVYRNSEILRECQINLGFRDLESQMELQDSETHGTFENMESQIPRNSRLSISEEVPWKTRDDPKNRNKDSSEFRELSILEIDRARSEERNGQPSSTHNQQNNHTSQLKHSEELSEENTKGLDENHASSRNAGHVILGEAAAGVGRPARNCSEKMDCKIGSPRWKTLEENDRRKAISKTKDELKGDSKENGALYKLIDVYDEHLEKFRNRCRPRTNEQRQMLREKFLGKFLSQSKDKHGEKSGEKVGEKFIKTGDTFGENVGRNFGKKPGEIFEKDVEETHGQKLGDKSEEKSGEKFEENLGEKLEEKFSGKSGAKTTSDSTPDDYNNASQWKERYEELWTVAQPFKDQLSAFHSQQQLLQGHRNAGKAEIEKLSHDFAKVLNHEHERQRISQILQLKEQNAILKKELELLRVRKTTTEVISLLDMIRNNGD